MHNWFNLKRKYTNDAMREHFKRIVVPYLRDRGFKGSIPLFKRIDAETHQIVQIQFNKYGRSFCVNLSVVEPTDNFFKKPMKDLTILRSQRLGTRQKRIKRKFNMDHWFKFLRGFIFFKEAYSQAAESVVLLYEEEGELILKDLNEAFEMGVSCIHLDKFLKNV